VAGQPLPPVDRRGSEQQRAALERPIDIAAPRVLER
jgi:hypothetical protein